MCKLYLKWIKFLCSFTAWVHIKKQLVSIEPIVSNLVIKLLKVRMENKPQDLEVGWQDVSG